MRYSKLYRSLKKKPVLILGTMALICALVIGGGQIGTLAGEVSEGISSPSGFAGDQTTSSATGATTVTGTIVAPGVHFEDPVRHTHLYLDLDEKTFRFTAPDGYDSGTVYAQHMRVKDGRVIIWHRDWGGGIFFGCNANINTDYCEGVLWARQGCWQWHRYVILDPEGVE